MKILVKINDMELDKKFDLSDSEGKDSLNRFVSEVYNIFYFFDEDDFATRFVELSTQYPYVFNNFSDRYIGDDKFLKLKILDFESKRNYIIKDENLLIDENIGDYVGEETRLREYIFSDSPERILDFESRYLNLNFKKSGG